MSAFEERTPSGRRTRRSIERDISATTARQADLIAYRQLRDVGLSDEAIVRRVDNFQLYLRTELPNRPGRSRRTRRSMLPASGVFSKHPGPLTIQALRWRAVLAAPPGARLTAESCCAAYDLLKQRGTQMQVTYLGSGWRPPRGVKGLTTLWLPGTDLGTVHGVPGVRVSRAIMDAAARVTPDVLDDILDRAVTLRLYDEADLRRVMRERDGARACAPLDAAIARLDHLTGEFLSGFERRVTRLVQGSAVISTPVVNVIVDGFRPDIRLGLTRGIVECDGGDYHRSMAQRIADERREAILITRGFCILRIRWDDLVYRPEETRSRIEQFALANAVPPDPNAPPARAVWW